MKNQKGFILPILVIVSLLILAVVAYFFSPKSLSSVNVKIPSLSPTVSTTLATNWKVFNDDINNISFRYPDQSWESNSLNDSLPFTLKNTSLGEKYNSIEISNITDTTIEYLLENDAIIEGKVDKKEFKSTTIGGKPSIQSVGISKSKLLPGKFYISLIQNNNSVVKIILRYESDIDVYNQILSTFKFTN